MISLSVTGLLLLISSAWMLYNFDRLSKAIKQNTDCTRLCNIDSESINNGRSYAIFTLAFSVIVFLITGQMIYSQFNIKK
jgi:hypothetical protein